jgi:negative regulator of flagellin synthesis FlgM
MEVVVKIGVSYGTGVSTEVGGVKPDGSRVSQIAKATPAAGANVRLSDLSSKLAEMEATLAKSDAFDVKKVEAIKQAIADGKFKVNPEAVADKLLANVRDMLGTQKG